MILPISGRVLALNGLTKLSALHLLYYLLGLTPNNFFVSGRVLVLNGLIIRSCLALLVVEQLAQYRHTHVTLAKKSNT